MDHDTPDVFLKTARFAVEAGIDLPRFAIVTPFPGTALHQRLQREGRILTRNWELYDGQHVVFQPAQDERSTAAGGDGAGMAIHLLAPVDRATPEGLARAAWIALSREPRLPVLRP